MCCVCVSGEWVFIGRSRGCVAHLRRVGNTRVWTGPLGTPPRETESLEGFDPPLRPHVRSLGGSDCDYSVGRRHCLRG